MAEATTSWTDKDEAHMRRALALAERATGFTAPNPLVGCVLVRGDQIIGEGFHRGRHWLSGGANCAEISREDCLMHAEAMALAEAGQEAARGATAYVTLEPCNHYGATPPCAQGLIDAGIARVVYAMADPNGVAAGGAARLRVAGITVEHGLCEGESRQLNRAWLARLAMARVHVTAKFAASLDGRIATSSGESKWITGPDARARAHDLRQASDGIIVGAGTVIADNPSLTVRNPDSANAMGAFSNPRRIILDTRARTSPMAKAYQHHETDMARPLLVTTQAAPRERLSLFRKQGIDVWELPQTAAGLIDLNALTSRLAKEGLNAVMVEGGAEILGSFFDAGLVDEVWAFLAPMIIGGSGRSAVAGHGLAQLGDGLRFDALTTETVGADILLRGQITREARQNVEEGAQCSQVS